MAETLHCQCLIAADQRSPMLHISGPNFLNSVAQGKALVKAIVTSCATNANIQRATGAGLAKLNVQHVTKLLPILRLLVQQGVIAAQDTVRVSVYHLQHKGDALGSASFSETFRVQDLFHLGGDCLTLFMTS